MANGYEHKDFDTLPQSVVRDSLEHLASELRNFQDIASYIKPRPGDVPRLEGFDIYGETLPLNGKTGGDHIIYLDFKQRYDLEARIRHAMALCLPEVARNLTRCQTMVGIVLIDVSGHRVTDALLAAMLHQSFLLGSLYELDVFGHITSHLFENLNTRFYQSSSIHKFITMIYGEITEDARFRFISAAHPPPIVFSRLHDRFMESGKESYVTCPPLGTLPSRNVIDRNTTQSVLGFKEAYELNEWEIMGAGDILLLYTDGLSEHANEQGRYFPGRLEARVRALKDRRARDIAEGIKDEVLSFAEPSDDISLVVIKRT